MVGQPFPATSSAAVPAPTSFAFPFPFAGDGEEAAAFLAIAADEGAARSSAAVAAPALAAPDAPTVARAGLLGGRSGPPASSCRPILFSTRLVTTNIAFWAYFPAGANILPVDDATPRERRLGGSPFCVQVKGVTVRVYTFRSRQ